MKLALVIPWFGRELKGGAEQQAWQIAARLAQQGHEVDVLTTCCRSHQDDWATNHLPAGPKNEPEGFTVHRFAVDARDRVAFDRVAGYLMNLPTSSLHYGVSPVSNQDSAVFAHELIKSEALLAYLCQERLTYDWFLLLPYLYTPVLRGLEIVGTRGALQPCLHDEAYAYLPHVAQAFGQAGKLLFNSEGERELALRLYGPGIWEKSFVVGEGVETRGAARREVAPNSTNCVSEKRFVLYLGRKDAGKNVPLLLRSFRRFQAVRPNSNLQLLLAGIGEIETKELPNGAEDLGLVSEEEKDDLLRDCLALFQPSQNESFSRVIMEAWMHGKPVAANRACLATATAVLEANGGWLAHSEEEWAQTFIEVDRSQPLNLANFGESGCRYAFKFADWDKVIERYTIALASPSNTSASRRPTRILAGRGINQFLPNLSFGDAISNHAIWIRDTLRELGIRSQIYVRYFDERMASECQVFTSEALKDSEAAIYHHSIGSEITTHMLAYRGPKCLIYHNITPAEFFRPFRPEFADLLQEGRDDLGDLSQHFPLSCGDSSFNSDELAAKRFSQPRVLPVAVDPTKWSVQPDADLMQRVQDGRTNILFVGRIAPNKKQDDLLRAFEQYLSFDPDARLVLVGKAEPRDPYADYINEIILTRGLAEHVVIPGSTSEAELVAYYRTARVFWSMSEHEGFCVPLVEAMWFDLPILAYYSSAVPETVGQGGLLFRDKNNLKELAALAFLLCNDDALRSTIIKHQRRRREAYLPRNVAPVLEDIATRLFGKALKPSSHLVVGSLGSRPTVVSH